MIDREQFEERSRALASQLVAGAAKGLEKGTLDVAHISAVLRDSNVDGVIEEVIMDRILPELSPDRDLGFVKVSLRAEAMRAKIGMAQVVSVYSVACGSINPQ